MLRQANLCELEAIPVSISGYMRVKSAEWDSVSHQNWLKCERMLEDCRYSSEWVCLTFEVGTPVGHNVFKNLAMEPYWIKNETGGRLWEKQ